MQDDRPIFLIGFMGSGKTTLARELAGRLGWGSTDTDELVERREGRTVERIFRESGEGYFRRVEWEALQGLDGRSRVVVATGGGLFLGVAQRRWMGRRGRTVWLDAPLEECERRLGAGPGRPMWHPGDRAAFRAFFEKRRAAYALAELRVDASRAPEEVARRVLERLRRSS